MTTLIKICGLKDAHAIKAASAADMMGFMFFDKSPRHVSLDMAAYLARLVPPHIAKVAVTVDADDTALSAIDHALAPHAVQLHGGESPARVREVRERFGVHVIKALPIASANDVEAAKAFDGVADLLLLDAKAPGGTDRPGGHGEPFDWSLLRTARFATKWLLAGGLSPANVADALAGTGAPGVDVSSGVESAPGIKSPELIEEFIANVRNTDAAMDRM